MAEVGIPHFAPSLANSFAGADSRAQVGPEHVDAVTAGFAGANTHTDVGVPHFAPSLPNGWTGTDTRASVGQPNNLGNPIGLPN